MMFNIWLIPLFTYLIGKFILQNKYNNEWVWWVTIPGLFIIWLSGILIFRKLTKGNSK